MAFIPIPNVAKITLQWIVAGQVVEIVISLQRAAGWTPASLSQAAIDVRDWYIANLRPLQTNTATLTNVNATDQSSSSAPSVDLPVIASNIGTATGTGEVNSVAAVTKFITALRGRSYRGRAYNHSISANNQVTVTNLSSGFAGLLTAAWAALPSFLTLSASQHVVASRYTGGAPRVTGVGTLVTGYATDQSFDAQRRRLAGRGI